MRNLEFFNNYMEENKNSWEEGEPCLTTDEQKKLNYYRREQIVRQLTSEERKEFLDLQEKESKNKERSAGNITEEEKNELRELRKIQIDREFTPEEKERFLFLQDKE
ncbi:MAG: hypothetical protein ACLFNR_01720 [Candidatus Paceibacterota bacterium]